MKDLNLRVFKIITEINELKTLKKFIHANVDENFMIENVIQIKGGKEINVNLSVKA